MRMKHPHIVRCVHRFHSDNETILLQELCEFGNLQSQIAWYVKYKGEFTDNWIMNALV